MKNFILATLGALIFGGAGIGAAAQTYQKFTDTKLVAGTVVNEQNRANTSWSSALALFENELQRQGKGVYNLSAAWIARNVYFEKVVKYVRMRGAMDIAASGSWEDVPNVIRKYGIVPAEAYMGLKGLDQIDYQVLNGTVMAYAVSAINGGTSLEAWIAGLNGILDANFGAMPETFVYGNRRYTPTSFRDMLGLNMDDYVCVTSFTHHPFYTWFAIEIPDNWAWGQAYNLPQEEMLAVATGALDRGFAVWWGAPDPGVDNLTAKAGTGVATADGSEVAKWLGVGATQRTAMLSKLLEQPINGREYTQAERQLAFDRYETSDDHGMLLTGIATDQDGGRYFKVKNAWGGGQDYSGFFYASYGFFKYKTLEVAMHKDALPRELKVRLGYLAK